MTNTFDIMTKIRLFSGLILMMFVASHLLNHMLALRSLEAVTWGRDLFIAVWRNPVITLVLYGALASHVVFAIINIYRRKSLKMPLWEAVQIGLGLLLPFWLAIHIVGTRGVWEFHDVDDSYVFQFSMLWPGGAIDQILLVLLVWSHGCIGMHFWLRFRPWYPPLQPWLLALAIAFPVLAISGFLVGAREVNILDQANPDWLAWLIETERWPDETVTSWIYGTTDLILQIFVALIATALLLRLVRYVFSRSRRQIRLSYPNDQVITIVPGMTVLEGSRAAGIPHASVCGGRGRCSTCRVRISHGVERLPRPSAAESKVLQRIGAADNIRLACQLRPRHDLTLTPLLPAVGHASNHVAMANPRVGIEREVAVMFADMRAFRQIAEGRLPFDTVFILNEYFKAMGSAIEEAGGKIDKYIGDGIVALFGIDSSPARGAMQALTATKAMAVALGQLNRHILADLKEPIRIGIGLHMGRAIIGELGYGDATRLTAIGETVDIAARLENATKEMGVQLVVSSRLTEEAAIILTWVEDREISIEGWDDLLSVHLVPDAEKLPIEIKKGVGASSGATATARSVLDFLKTLVPGRAEPAIATSAPAGRATRAAAPPGDMAQGTARSLRRADAPSLAVRAPRPSRPAAEPPLSDQRPSAGRSTERRQATDDEVTLEGRRNGWGQRPKAPRDERS